MSLCLCVHCELKNIGNWELLPQIHFCFPKAKTFFPFFFLKKDKLKFLPSRCRSYPSYERRPCRPQHSCDGSPGSSSRALGDHRAGCLAGARNRCCLALCDHNKDTKWSRWQNFQEIVRLYQNKYFYCTKDKNKK